MSKCARCSNETSRRRRNPWQRIFYRAVIGCDFCGERVFIPRSTFGFLQRYSQCPQCGTRDLSKLRSRDHVEKMNRNPLRMLLGLVGAPLYHCTFCRLQFRDPRKRSPEVAKFKSGKGARSNDDSGSVLNLVA